MAHRNFSDVPRFLDELAAANLPEMQPDRVTLD